MRFWPACKPKLTKIFLFSFCRYWKLKDFFMHIFHSDCLANAIYGYLRSKIRVVCKEFLTFHAY